MSGPAIPDDISRPVEDALAACGRDRVMHRSDAEPAVAIRWDGTPPITAPDGTERYLRRSGSTLDEAGRAAAQAFAQRIRDEARRLEAWADRIERPLKNSASPGKAGGQ